MKKALLIYASLTGNTVQAVRVVQKALENLDIDVTVEESVAADVYDFEDYDINLIATYTWGPDGALPDEIIDVYEELQELDLSDKIYGVFGTGDTFYEDLFCKSVTDFEKVFKNTGAKHGAENVLIDLAPEDEDIKKLQTFAKKLAEA